MLLQESHFITLLRKQAGKDIQPIMFACVGSGVFQGVAVFSVLSGIEQLSGSGVHFSTFLLFLLSIGIFYYLFRYITGQAALLALRGIMEWRMRIASKLRAAPMLYLESLPKQRIQNVLTNDHEMEVEAARMLMAATANSVMIIVAVIAMFVTSFIGAVGVLVCMGFGLYVFMNLVKDVDSTLSPAKKANIDFSSNLMDLQNGFQHLKVHKGKTRQLFKDFLMPGLERVSIAREATEKRHSLGISFFALFNLLMLGIILFLMPRILGIDAETTTTLLVLSMFCLSPLMSLVSFVPMLSKVEFSLQELYTAEKELDQVLEQFEKKEVAKFWQGCDIISPEFQSLVINNLCFDYTNKDGNAVFGIRIKHFSLNKGEIVFIRGGNGTGKSTFMKALSGLYLAQSGDILINDRPISDLGMEAYRNLFSILPSDFHIFKIPIGRNVSIDDIQKTLVTMKLESRVYIEDDLSFSTLDISAGQKKRLALACTLLEDREIFLFDEVAADFDPHFRKFFYTTLLQNLKSQGKTILAISHDDNYFSCADRVLTMNEGALIEDTIKNKDEITA